MNVCTIIAKNYVAHARVLARSLAETHPGSRLWTLVIDDFSRHIDPAREPFEILTPAQVGCDPFLHMALRYSVLELSTAVKPWLLRHLLQETGGPVTYLDPDIRIYGSLEPLGELAERHGVVLIPHNSRPIPQDERKPSQVDVMIAGIYNLGYVSLASRPEVDQLLDWWADRLRRDCRVDPVRGYFVDQRWFDLAPGFLSDLSIMRDPEYNLAYWNLHQRRLEHEDGRYRVDDRALAFFHFSGFDPEQPLILSRHQDRIDVLERPVLERLLAEYAQSVMSEGHGDTRHWPYEFEALGDGSRLEERLRGLLDEFAGEHEGAVPSPFTLDGVRVFDRWLTEAASGAPPGINRALARVYQDRPDIRGMFPDLAGDDRAAFLAWAGGPGLADEPVLARVGQDGRPSAVAIRRAPDPAHAGELHSVMEPFPVVPAAELRPAPWGVNVVGEFGSGTELGQAARAMVATLDERGVRTLPVRVPAATSDQRGQPYRASPPGDAPFPVNLICLSPEALPDYARDAGAEFFAGRYSVGLWFWDADRLPGAWRERFSLLEEVWAPSAYVARALEPSATVPVHTVAIPVAPSPGKRRGRAELGLPEREFLFHFRFDYRDGFERKNPLGLIEAFRRAFSPGEGACLWMQCFGAAADPEHHRQLCRAAAEHPDIQVVDGESSPARLGSATELCDCYVSLHRAEAFGAAMADAMWFAKPVIATGYSGNLDFMTADNSHLVEHALVPVGAAQCPYPADAQWAEANVEHAGALMRQVFDDRVAARALGATGAVSIRATHSPQVAGEVLHRRLESIRAVGRSRRGADPALTSPPAVAGLPMRIARGPFPAAPGTGQAVRERLRQAVLRVIRPFTTYQHTVNVEMAAALAELSRGIAATRADTRATRADILAANRRLDEIVRRIDGQTDESAR